MARLLAYNAPATGHILPCTGMLLELARRGHEVHVRTRGSDVDRLTSLGLHAAPVDPAIEAIELDDWRGKNALDALERLQRVMQQWAEREIPDLRDAIDAVRPDALIVDANCEGAGFAAEASGLPWVSYCPFPPVFRSKDTPPYGPGMAPARGALGRARDRLTTRVFDHSSKKYVAPLNRMRAELGLARIERLEDAFLRADRLILFTAPPYEYDRSDWPSSVRLVGPITWEPSADPPSWLRTETRPIVLVTASTVRQADEVLIATSLEALRDEALAVVVTAGAHDAASFAVPPNARVEAYAPHGHILERAACVVSHGGQGITMKALAAGVPVCVVPFCRDQFEVARRVEVCGAGVRLHHKRLSAERLRTSVHAAMTKRSRAERVAEGFALAGGASAAADAVDEVLDARVDLPIRSDS